MSSFPGDVLPFDVDHYPANSDYIDRLVGVNPVIKYADTSSTQTTNEPDLLADPFIVPKLDKSGYYMFYELLVSTASNVKNIAVSESSNLENWSYLGEVLFPGLKAYPVVLRHNNKWYMVPTDNDENFYVYTTTDANFPFGWVDEEVSLPGVDIIDPNVFSAKDENGNQRWWLLTAENVSGNRNNRTNLYFSGVGQDLETATWSAHPQNPVLTITGKSRPGGRGIIPSDGKYIFYLQDNTITYGKYLRVYEASFSTTAWSVQELNDGRIYLDGTDDGMFWNSVRMHHCDPVWGKHFGKMGNFWIMAVDGSSANTGNWQCGVFISKVPSGHLEKSIGGIHQSNNDGIIETINR